MVATMVMPAGSPPRAPGGREASSLAGTVDRLRRTAAEAEQLTDLEGLTTADRRELVAGLDAVIAALTSARARVLLVEQATGGWRGSGDRSFEAWRGRTARTGVRAASAELRQATTLNELNHVRSAATQGTITLEHVGVLAKVAATAAPAVREALTSDAGQRELVGLARRLDAGTFAGAAARWAARLDAESHERGHQAQRAARYLHLTHTPDGTRLSGLLDAMTGHRLRLALEAVTPRPATDDERTPEQRRADALAVLAETVLSLPETRSGAAVRPHISFTMAAATWSALRARQAGIAARGGPTTSTSFDPVTLDDGTPVPLSEVGRALCDCELTRIVVAADGAPLDVGRAQRTFTGPQRRAVVTRDRTCRWRGCRAPARWCEIHHIRWWDRDGGETSVDNGVLLCSYHHHEVHRFDLIVTRELRAQVDPGAGPGEEDVGGRDVGPDAGCDVGLVTYRFTTPGGRVVSPAAGPVGC